MRHYAASVGIASGLRSVLPGLGISTCRAGRRISGTHRSGPPSLRVNEAAAFPPRRLCCPAGPTGTTAASDSLPAPRPLPGSSPVIGQDLPRAPRARSGRGGPPQFPPSPSERSAPSTPDSPSRLRFQDLHRFHGLRRDYRGSALSYPLTTRQASLDATDRSVAPLLKGFRRWAPTRPVSRPSRQPATGLPGDYPDRTFTGRRRRASDQVMIAGQPPPDALGARNFGLRARRLLTRWFGFRGQVDTVGRGVGGELGQGLDRFPGWLELRAVLL